MELGKLIINNDYSKAMQIISSNPFPAVNKCNVEILEKLYDDDPLLAFCIFQIFFFLNWIKLRQFRITGSRICNIYTYCSNSHPDWKKKHFCIFIQQNFRANIHLMEKNMKKYEKI